MLATNHPLLCPLNLLHPLIQNSKIRPIWPHPRSFHVRLPFENWKVPLSEADDVIIIFDDKDSFLRVFDISQGLLSNRFAYSRPYGCGGELGVEHCVGAEGGHVGVCYAICVGFRGWAEDESHVEFFRMMMYHF